MQKRGGGTVSSMNFVSAKASKYVRIPTGYYNVIKNLKMEALHNYLILKWK